MKRKTITFTVQIQADFFGRQGKKEEIATEICDDLNQILATHEGTVGGAQIMSEPKDIIIESLED